MTRISSFFGIRRRASAPPEPVNTRRHESVSGPSVIHVSATEIASPNWSFQAANWMESPTSSQDDERFIQECRNMWMSQENGSQHQSTERDVEENADDEETRRSSRCSLFGRISSLALFGRSGSEKMMESNDTVSASREPREFGRMSSKHFRKERKQKKDKKKSKRETRAQTLESVPSDARSNETQERFSLDSDIIERFNTEYDAVQASKQQAEPQVVRQRSETKLERMEFVFFGGCPDDVHESVEPKPLQSDEYMRESLITRIQRTNSTPRYNYSSLSHMPRLFRPTLTA